MLAKYEEGNKKQRKAVNEIMQINGYPKFTEWDLEQDLSGDGCELPLSVHNTNEDWIYENWN